MVPGVFAFRLDAALVLGSGHKRADQGSIIGKLAPPQSNIIGTTSSTLATAG